MNRNPWMLLLKVLLSRVWRFVCLFVVFVYCPPQKNSWWFTKSWKKCLKIQKLPPPQSIYISGGKLPSRDKLPIKNNFKKWISENKLFHSSGAYPQSILSSPIPEGLFSLSLYGINELDGFLLEIGPTHTWAYNICIYFCACNFSLISTNIYILFVFFVNYSSELLEVYISPGSCF